MVAREAPRGLVRGLGRVRVPGDAHDQHTLLLTRPAQGEIAFQTADEESVPGHNQRRRGFDSGAETQHRQRQFGLHDLPDGIQSCLEGGEEKRMEFLAFRQRADAHGSLGDETQPSLGTEYKLAHIRPGGGGGDVRGDVPRPCRRLDAPACEQFLDPSVAERLLPAGACGDPSTKRRILEGLRIVPQGAAVRAQVCLEIRSGDARFERRQVAGGIDGAQAAHAPHIHGEDGRVAGQRVDLTHDAGAPPVRNETRACVLGVVNEFPPLLTGSLEGIPPSRKAFVVLRPNSRHFRK